MTEAILLGALAVQAATAVLTVRVMRLVHRTSIHAMIAQTPQEFAMLEKAATPPRVQRVRAAKSDPVHPYGL